VKLLPYGERALLAEVADNAEVLRLREAVVGIDGVLDVVPAARTLLVEFDPAVTSARRVEALLTSADRTPRPLPRGEHVEIVEISVRYDGADLDSVADEVGLSASEVVRLHSAPTYTVAFCGFAPGFAYLTGLDAALRVGRLDEPRTAVPAGAVAIAGEFTGVYPRPSPGGWRLLGSTDASLWDPSRDRPALLAPGTSVRFTPA
jgi:5-oxoprolinase (ATP-hydrolysing) subunit B